jgi:hypothetical protein
MSGRNHALFLGGAASVYPHAWQEFAAKWNRQHLVTSDKIDNRDDA